MASEINKKEKKDLYCLTPPKNPSFIAAEYNVNEQQHWTTKAALC